MALFQPSEFCVKPGCNLNFFKSLISCVHVFHGLPVSLWPWTSLNLQLLPGFSMSILITYLNHISVVWRRTSTVLVTLRLFLNSADDFLSLKLILHIHRTIWMPVWEILLISLSFRGQTSLPYSITVLKQAVYNFPFILYEETLDLRRGKSSLNFFQPDLTRDIVLASTPPLAYSMPSRSCI